MDIVPDLWLLRNIFKNDFCIEFGFTNKTLIFVKNRHNLVNSILVSHFSVLKTVLKIFKSDWWWLGQLLKFQVIFQVYRPSLNFLSQVCGFKVNFPNFNSIFKFSNKFSYLKPKSQLYKFREFENIDF